MVHASHSSAKPAHPASKVKRKVKEQVNKQVNKQRFGAIVCLLLMVMLAGCSPKVSVATQDVTTSPAAAKAVSKTSATQQANQRIAAKVVRVVDGDTMKVSYTDNGKVKEETIRLLLVDTPESVDPEKPVQPFAVDASNYAKDMLTGKDVGLEMDVSERDKYGRLLCYLYIGDKMFNELLLENGYARVAYVYPPNVKYVDQFREIQKTAQQKGLNIWSLENYAQEDGFHDVAAKGKASAVGSQTPAPTSRATTQPKSTAKSGAVTYNSCKEANAAGAYGIKKGEPGYSAKLDGDKDGIACE